MGTLCVYPGDSEEKSKHSVWRITSLPSFFNGKRLHAIDVTVIGPLPVLIGAVEDLGIIEGTYLLISIGIGENSFFQFTFLVHCSIVDMMDMT